MLKHYLAGLAAAFAIGLATTASADIFESASAPGKCLNMSTGGVSIQPCDGSGNQDLAIVSVAGGRVIVAGVRCVRMNGQGNMPELVQCAQPWGVATRFSMVNNGPISGDGLCLDVKGGKTNAGTRVIGFGCNGQNNQRWLRTVTGKTPGDNLGEANANLTLGRLSANHAPYLCLNVGPGGRLNTRNCNSATKFKFALGVPATPMIGPGNKCLEANGGQGQQIGANGQCGLGGADWTFTTNGLLRGANGLCADVEGASNNPGARVIFFKCSGSSNQRFTVVN
jgi:hypothetical protein